MDPKEVKLTTGQKILPLIKAINEEVPWQIILVFSIGIVAAIFGGDALPPSSALKDNPFWDFVIRRILVGGVIGAASLLLTAFGIFLVEEKIMPLVRRVRKNYEEEALKVKKKVLDNCIDDEILRK